MNNTHCHRLTKGPNFFTPNFIDDQYESCKSTRFIKKHSPCDGIFLCSLDEDDIDELDQTVANTQAAFEYGYRLKLFFSQRKVVLQNLASLIQTDIVTFTFYRIFDSRSVIFDCSATSLGGPVDMGVEGHHESVFDYEEEQADLDANTVTTGDHAFFMNQNIKLKD